MPAEELFRRAWPDLLEPRVARTFSGKVVLVTGAAGSIGSEVCRRLMDYSPDAIVAFDSSEGGLFELEQKLQSVRSVPGNILDAKRVREVLQEYRPSVLIHAAAYKHVPILERNPGEAIQNNVIGAWNVASIAAEQRVPRVVLVSTDKAARARNVLGFTKRAAEMLVGSLGRPGREYFAVRLGNVIGSSGSVTRTFESQIERGGPVTVTDCRMKRYFTTLSEAARFILTSAAIGNGGACYVLSMGEPVSIVDLARKLCALNGRSDIPVVFTGIRPGEELFEELLADGEEALATEHPLIQRIGKMRS